MTDRSPIDSPPPAPDNSSASSPCTALFVDAIEDGVARVLGAQGEESWSLPLTWLPAGTREGDWLSLTARRSSPPHPRGGPEGETTEGRRANLSADDPGGPIKL